jgi:hydroxypyruvate reductase
MIASGPACPDSTTCQQALAIVEKYDLQISEEIRKDLRNQNKNRDNTAR